MLRCSGGHSSSWLVLAGLALISTGCGRRAPETAPLQQPTATAPPATVADVDRGGPTSRRAENSEQGERGTGIPHAEIEAEIAETQKQIDEMVAGMEQPGAGPESSRRTVGAKTATEPEPGPGPAKKPEGTVVVGKITAVSNVPDPSTVPYKDCVTFIKYDVQSVESGDYDGDELLAVFWGMRDAKLQPAAKFSAGDRHRLTIQPFSERQDLARVMQADDTNEFSLTPYWVISYTGR